MLLISRRPAPLLLPAVLVIALSGCAADSDSPAVSQAASSDPATDEVNPQDPAGEQPAEAQVETGTGPCPYLEQAVVEETVGQQISTVLVTTSTPATGPLPKCEFRRASGEPAAITETLSIEAGTGLARALELVPGGNPVTAGEGGSVLVHQGQDRTDLAAFSGTTMVTVTINQESSLEATDLAELVLAAAG